MNNSCSVASPYRRLDANSTPYSADATIASGQAVTLTRRLHHTIAIDSTTATISSQVIGLPHSTNAGASSRRCDGQRLLEHVSASG